MDNALPWLILLAAVGSQAHREHKIHNIILYPHKHSWCEIQEIKQVISFPGCKSIEIDNNVCVGACFSYSIPHTLPSDPGEVIVPYCDSCQPSETKWHEVALDCREGHQNDPEQAPRLLKKVQLIHNCSCSSCEKGLRNQGLDHDDDLSLQDENAPELLDLHMMNETHESKIETKHRENLRSILNNTLMTLLKNIQESNSATDKAQLKDLLKMIRDQYPDENYSDESIAEIVESFNSDQISLDIPKLKEILFKFELSKYNHQHQQALKTNEVHLHSKHPHHHSGESIGGGHLTHGPHGSLVVAPVDPNVNIHSKLDVNPHDFKQNHAGTIVSYDSHHPSEKASEEDEE
jgi:neuroblastoma suppressor of tumorigenicity 1